jgi:glycosyltransferase involved in cell wall biosynthesis
MSLYSGSHNITDFTLQPRFEAGDYAGVAQLGGADDWRTNAALGLIGKTAAAVAGLRRFDSDEARFYEAAAQWIDGNEAEAIRLLTPLTMPHARNLLALIRKDVIRVLTQWPDRTQWPQDLLGAARADTKFEVRNVSFHPDDIRNQPGADARTWIDSRTPPDFYNCLTVEWQIPAPNLRQLSCPILAATADYDADLQVVLPWLSQFDELIVTSRTEWSDVKPLTTAPVSSFPKLFGVSETLPPLRGVDRRHDVYFSGTVQHPFHPDKARLLQQVMEMPDLGIHVINGFVSAAEYHDLMSDSRVCYTYVRHPGGMPTRGLEALSMGCAVVIQRECVLGLWVGEEEGVLTYDLEAGDLPVAVRKVVDNWPVFAERARRGADIIRREFRVSRIVSQYLRFLTFLAARPHTRAAVPAAPLLQKRQTMLRGWTPRDPEVRSRMLADVLNKAMPCFDADQNAPLTIYLDAARELVLEYGAQALFGKPTETADHGMIDAALNLYQRAILAHPGSLVPRFNAIRVGIHFGTEAQRQQAYAEAREVLARTAEDWRIGLMEDVFPWDFFPEEFHHRAYLDLAMESLKTGRNVTAELRALILASLWSYLGQAEIDGRAAFAEATRLDPAFAVYGLHYARALLRHGSEAGQRQAGDILAALADGTPVCAEAFALLTPLVKAGKTDCPRFPQLAEAQARMKAGLGRGVESWQMAEAAANTAAQEGASEAIIRRSGPHRDYLISAIVPIYNAERFIRGLLEDLEAQTIADRLEIVICNTGSPQDEQAIIDEFMTRYDNIVYIYTPHRENSHEAANRCIAAASGTYLTLACADDRHRPDALEVMARTLERYPETGLVYADTLVTVRPNETWAANSAHSVYRWPDFSLRQALMFSCFGPQPMWRRELHEICGACDPELLVAGDYDLFLRLAIHAGARHIPEVLGLFLEGGNAMRDPEACKLETLQILARYRPQLALERLYPGLAQLADAFARPGIRGENERKLTEAICLLDYGNLTLRGSCPDIPHAVRCYEQARELIGNNPVVVNNLALSHALAGDISQALSLLEPLARGGNAEARHNYDQIRLSRGEICDLRVGALAHRVLANLPPLVPPAQVSQPWITQDAAPGGRSSAPHASYRQRPQGYSFVIITGGQRRELLRLVINSIRAQCIEDYEILVVGNHVQEPGITYLPAEQRRLGLMRNIGMRQARYSRIVFLDDDCVLAPNWYRSMQEAPADFDILTLEIRLPDGSRYWDLTTSGGPRGNRILLPEEAAADSGIYATGGAMMIAAHVAQSVEWNEDLGVGLGEDVEFSRRCQAHGYVLTHHAASRVYHADATYTSIGRWCVRRKEGRTHEWVKAALRNLTAQEIFVRGSAHLGHDETAEGVDCFRYGLLLYPEYEAFRQALAFVEQLSGGHLPGVAWYPDGDPAFHAALALYRKDTGDVVDPDHAADDPGSLPEYEKSVTLSALDAAAQLSARTRLAAMSQTAIMSRQSAGEIEAWLHALEAAGASVDVTPIRQSKEAAALPVGLKAQLGASARMSPPGEIHISCLPPPHFTRSAGARANIGLAQFPTDGLPQTWVDACNRMDAIWVPSEFNRSTFIHAGVSAAKLQVVPTGLVMAHWRPDVKPLPIQGARGFNFLCLLDWSHANGWDILVRSFVREFSERDDVALILKVASTGRSTPQQVTDQVVRNIRLATGGNTDAIPTIILDTAPVAIENRPNLYRSTDCFVLPARAGEGNRAYMEAMAMGLPTIGTNWGGATEYMNPANSYLIDCRLVSVAGEAVRENPELRGHRWAEPDQKHLSALLRQVFTEREQARRAGAQARWDMAARFDYAQAAATVRRELAVWQSRVPALAGRREMPQQTAHAPVSLEILLP